MGLWEVYDSSCATLLGNGFCPMMKAMLATTTMIPVSYASNPQYVAHRDMAGRNLKTLDAD